MTVAQQALVYDAHEYEPLSKTADPHGNGDDCDCSPACKVCGSAKDAYVHSDEAREKGYTLTVRVAAADSGSSSDSAAAS